MCPKSTNNSANSIYVKRIRGFTFVTNKIVAYA